MQTGHGQLVDRYKRNYGLTDDANVTTEMILSHWELERGLARELLGSAPEDRWTTFERCYTRLYSELTWLNDPAAERQAASSQRLLGRWAKEIGATPQSIYEIGSGKGELMVFLAKRGHKCKGTEITAERGRTRLADSPGNLAWAVSDGIHLERFEARGTFDVLISDQVVEHLHPDDLAAHLSSSHALLKQAGRYIIRTPHRFTGPHDISRVFKQLKPSGMHLKEYTYSEIGREATRAGYRRLYCGFIPGPVETSLRVVTLGMVADRKRAGWICLKAVLALEAVLGAIPSIRVRKALAGLLCSARIFPNNINMVAEK